MDFRGKSEVPNVDEMGNIGPIDSLVLDNVSGCSVPITNCNFLISKESQPCILDYGVPLYHKSLDNRVHIPPASFPPKHATFGTTANAGFQVPESKWIAENILPETQDSYVGHSRPNYAPPTPVKSVTKSSGQKSDVQCSSMYSKLSEQINEQEFRISSEFLASMRVDSEKEGMAAIADDDPFLIKDQRSNFSDVSDAMHLNQTPQKKSRRKKHRPKVISEKKPKKPKLDIDTGAASKIRPKRKYVKKNVASIVISSSPMVTTEENLTGNKKGSIGTKLSRQMSQMSEEPEASDSLVRVQVSYCKEIRDGQVYYGAPGTSFSAMGNYPHLVDHACESHKVRLSNSYQSESKKTFYTFSSQTSCQSSETNEASQNSLISCIGKTYTRKKPIRSATSLAIVGNSNTESASEVFNPRACFISGVQSHVSGPGDERDSLLPSSIPRISNIIRFTTPHVSQPSSYINFLTDRYPVAGLPVDGGDPSLINSFSHYPGIKSPLIAFGNEQLTRTKRTKRSRQTNYSHFATLKKEKQMKMPSLANCVHFANDESGIPIELMWKTDSHADKLPIQVRDLDREKGAEMIKDTNLLLSHEHNNGLELALYSKESAIQPIDHFLHQTKKHRPKVFLDEETKKVWNLLMEGVNTMGIEGTDEEKANWWRSERNVFKGRAMSFISRMHLIQGDRRFSGWKGSVVDSVVGVFLTQNVADHLSSSAFMSLAARFPNKAEKIEENCDENGNSMKLECSAVQSMHVSYDSSCETSFLSQTCVQGRGTTKSVGLKVVLDTSYEATYDSSTAAAEEIHRTEHTKKMEGSKISLSSQQQLKNMAFDNLIPFRNLSCLELLNFVTLGQEHPCDRIGSDTCFSFQNHGCSNAGMEHAFVRNYRPGDGVLMSPMIGGNNSAITSGPANCNPVCRGTLTYSVQEKQEVSKSSEVKVLSSSKTSSASSGPLNNSESKIQRNSSFNNGGTVDYEGVRMNEAKRKAKSRRVGDEIKENFDWESLRRQVGANGNAERSERGMDSLDWDAVRCADVGDIAETIKERGMNNMLAARIKDFLERLTKEHGGIDLEWLRDIPPDKAKEYLLTIKGLGLKSVECVRLLTLQHLAFPVDTNVGRIVVRLGWVPIQPLPESLQLHLLELYPMLESIQKYLWPRLCKLDQKTLYELHYQLITFGKVFCTKSKPNCNACPMRGECRHFASAFASARLALPASEQMSSASATRHDGSFHMSAPTEDRLLLPASKEQSNEVQWRKEPVDVCVPIVELPHSPEPDLKFPQSIVRDIEDCWSEDPDEIPTIKLNMTEFSKNLQHYMQNTMDLNDSGISMALVALSPEAAAIPTPQLKNVSRLRTEHQVYVLPDSHPLIQQLDRRESDDPCFYLLAILSPGETSNCIEKPETCSSQGEGTCDHDSVQGTLLIPCRTAMRGSFPLNGTYFQVNEVFADHESSLSPIHVPREWIWDLPRRIVYFGTSISSIFRGLTTEEIQRCFWKGYVCVRGFDRKTRSPKHLVSRLHLPASKLTKRNRPINKKSSME